MNSIDITTSHNIVVSVELAKGLQRVVATVLDFIVMVLYASVVSSVSDSEFMKYLLFLPVISFYHLAFEIFNKGQSLGKMVVKLKVVSLTGNDPSIMDLIMRWMFRTLDIALSLGLLAISFIISTPRRQRIGDLLANTVVVKTNNEDHIDLMTIKNIGTEERIIQYPHVTLYNDSDMLLVKQAIKRYRDNKSPANRDLVIQLADKIAADQKVKVSKGKRIKFLKTVLEEYIVQTR